jgi:hypothetical protein
MADAASGPLTYIYINPQFSGIICGRQNYIQILHELGHLDGLRVSREDDVVMAHIHAGGEEITARIAEAYAKNNRNECPPLKWGDIHAETFCNITRLWSIQKY